MSEGPAAEPAVPLDTSRDDTDLGWGDVTPDDDEQRLRAERPPHHDTA